MEDAGMILFRDDMNKSVNNSEINRLHMHTADLKKKKKKVYLP